MEEATYKDWILETIDQLRKRKARPDLERICHMVERKHGLSFEEIEADLERLVDAGIVFKVDYKGSTSYRNAAKWKKSPPAGSLQNSNDVSRRILDAVRTLTEPLVDDSCSDADDGRNGTDHSGVSFSEIENWMEEEEPDMNLVENVLESALQREVDAGCLNKLPNGNFVFICEEPVVVKPSKAKTPQKTPSKAKASAKSERDNAADTAAAAATTASAAEKNAGGNTPKNASPGKKTSRTSTKRKNIKRILDPDFELGPTIGPKHARKDTIEGTHKVSRKDSIDKHNRKDGVEKHSRKDSVDKHSRKDSVNKHSRKDSVDKHSRKDSIDKHSRKDSVDKARKDNSSEGKARKTSATPPPVESPVVSPPDAIMEGEPRCDFCLNTAEKNRKGEPEGLLICRDCQAKAHPSCMEYSEDLAKRARNSPWQCIDCKTCYICEDAGDPDAMLFCDACDKGYHMTCHKPPIDDKPKGTWVCSKCVVELGLDPQDAEMKDVDVEDDDDDDEEQEEEEEQEEKNMEEEEEDDDETEVEDEREGTESTSTESEQRIKMEDFNGDGGPSCLPTPNASPVHFKQEPPEPTESKPKLGHSIHVVAPLPKLADTMTADVPDASEWTIEDVVSFFKGMGFIDQCEVFREQEIDGKSLLLMKRSDVLQGLSLRLGPALKIFAHVQRLQTKGQILL